MLSEIFLLCLSILALAITVVQLQSYLRRIVVLELLLQGHLLWHRQYEQSGLEPQTGSSSLEDLEATALPFEDQTSNKSEVSEERTPDKTE